MECTNDYSQILQRLEALEEENRVLKSFVVYKSGNYRENESIFKHAIDTEDSKLMEFCLTNKLVEVHTLVGRESERNYPLFYAIQKGKLVCAEILFKHRANINRGLDYQTYKTPLEYAAAHKNAHAALDWLIAKKADVTTDALNLACEAVNTYAIEKLLESGAKPIAGNSILGPKNTIDYAPKEKQAAIQKIFDEFAGKEEVYPL